MTRIVEKQAQSLRRKLNYRVEYEDLESLASKHNFRVHYYADSNDTIITSVKSEKLANTADSFIYRDKADTYNFIFIKKGLSPSDNLFLLAHEVAHILLKHGASTISKSNTEQEKEATVFANILLAHAPVKYFLWKYWAALLLAMVPFIFTIAVGSLQHIERQYETSYYITRTGDKYHLPSCYYVRDKNDLIEITLQEAEKGGYGPCKVCIGE